jgi:hypothetical protein
MSAYLNALREEASRDDLLREIERLQRERDEARTALADAEARGREQAAQWLDDAAAMVEAANVGSPSSRRTYAALSRGIRAIGKEVTPDE